MDHRENSGSNGNKRIPMDKTWVKAKIAGSIPIAGDCVFNEIPIQ